jgi:hypothetical protein
MFSNFFNFEMTFNPKYSELHGLNMKTQFFCYFSIPGDRERCSIQWNRFHKVCILTLSSPVMPHGITGLQLMMEAEPASNRCICCNKNETWKESSTCPVTHQCNKSLYFASSLSADKNLMMFVRSLLPVSFAVVPLTLLPAAALAFQFITAVFVGLNDTIFYLTE